MKKFSHFDKITAGYKPADKDSMEIIYMEIIYEGENFFGDHQFKIANAVSDQGKIYDKYVSVADKDRTWSDVMKVASISCGCGLVACLVTDIIIRKCFL